MSAPTATGRDERKPPSPSPVGIRRRGGPGWRTVWRYAAMPAFLVAVGVGLYLYLGAAELDSIEQRALDPTVLIRRTIQHVQLSFAAAAITVVLAVPFGVMCTRPWARRIRPFFIALANVGQATPSLGLIAIIFVLFAAVLPTGFQQVTAGLVAYAFLPILRNTIAGIEAVDPTLIESARGMGLSQGQVLRRVELPLAVPVMAAGIRVALVLAVGTATLAFLFPGVEGLGQTINAGQSLGRLPVLFTGAVLVAMLALLVDYLAGIAEDILRPKGLGPVAGRRDSSREQSGDDAPRTAAA